MISAAELLLVWRLFRVDAARNRKRIALTVMAIAWGTLSIVLLLSFGEGMKRSFHRNARGMGEGIGVLWPGATTKRLRRACPPGRTISFTDEDAELLGARIPEIARHQPRVRQARPRDARAPRPSTRACAAWTRPSARCATSSPQAGGRFLNELDSAQKRRVVVLGDELATDLFGKDDPVGKTVQINQSTFLVVGRHAAQGDDGHVQRARQEPGHHPRPHLQGHVHRRARSATWSTSRRARSVGDQAKAQIYRVLGRKYRFDPDDTRALGVWDTRENQRITGNIALGIQMFLGIIGALTLFVGGMGVANIMYAVVKERTREIGVKMALGAKVRQVMAPFVLEALMMTVIGGLLGTVGVAGPHGRHRRAAPEGRGLRLPGPAHLLARHRRRHRR